jgi:hypothetical protein
MAGQDPDAIGGAWDQDINLIEALGRVENKVVGQHLSDILLELKIIRLYMQEMNGFELSEKDVSR